MDYGTAFGGAYLIMAFALFIFAPVIAIFHWWAGGRLDTLQATGLMIVAAVLAIAAILGPATWVRVFAWCCLLVAAVYVLIVRRSEGPAGHRAIDQRRVEEFTELVRSNPTQIPNRVALAESLYKLGREVEAIEQLEYAITLAVDQSTVSEERRKLAIWKEYRSERLGEIRRCTNCHATKIDGHLDKCPRCGAPLAPSDQFSGWVESGQATRMAPVLGGGLGIVTAGLLLNRLIPGPIGGLMLFAALAGATIYLFVRWPRTP